MECDRVCLLTKSCLQSEDLSVDLHFLVLFYPLQLVHSDQDQIAYLTVPSLLPLSGPIFVCSFSGLVKYVKHVCDSLRWKLTRTASHYFSPLGRISANPHIALARAYGPGVVIIFRTHTRLCWYFFTKGKSK